MDLPAGGVFIALVACGTAGYVLWLLFEAVFDPYEFGRSWKGIAERIGIALSTLAYGAIVTSAAKVFLGGNGDHERQQQHLVNQVLHWPAGQWLVGAAGLLVAVVGVYQIKYVHEGDHARRLRVLLRAAWSFDPRAVGDTDSAFDFLGLGGGAVGNTLFSAVAGRWRASSTACHRSSGRRRGCARRSQPRHMRKLERGPSATADSRSHGDRARVPPCQGGRVAPRGAATGRGSRRSTGEW